MKKIPVVCVTMIASLTACGSATDTEDSVDATENSQAADAVIEPTAPDVVVDSEFSRNLNENFRRQFATNFIRSCVAEAVKAGAQEIVVRPVCECTSGELLKRVNSYVESANPSHEKMMAAARYCVGKLSKS